jgi:hypothetical protein
VGNTAEVQWNLSRSERPESALIRAPRNIRDDSNLKPTPQQEAVAKASAQPETSMHQAG